MFAELIESGKLRTEQEHERSITVINREARRLSQLVENILQFSRSSRGAVDIKLETLEVRTTLEEILEAFRPLALARNDVLELKVDSQLMLRADRDHLNQILLNLLDNAVKYGPEGQTITVNAAMEGGAFRLSVEDEGSGVPHHERQRIWEPYQRLDADTKQPATGTGIGLVVVRDLVDLHGGKAWVENTTDGGARFVVELPGVSSGASAGPPASARGVV